jgi:hypothetical protein
MEKVNYLKAIIKKNPKIDYFIIFAIALHVLFWFEDDLLYNAGEICIPLNPIENFRDRISSWSPSVLGYVGLEIPRVFKYGFFAFFKYLGFSLPITERIYFVFWYGLAGISAYYLTLTLFDETKEEYRRVMGLISAFVYMFNPFLFFTIASASYSTLPLIIAFTIKYMKATNVHGKILYGLYLSVASFLASVLYPDLSIWICLLIFVIFYLIFYSEIIAKRDIKSFISSILIATTILVLTNLWWLLPYLSFSVISSALGTLWLGSASSPYTSFLNIFRLFGAWTFYQRHEKLPYIPYAHNYSSMPFITVVNFLIPIMCFSALFFKRNKQITFLSLITIIFLFLTKGPHPPFGEYYNWLLRNFPVLASVRESYKFVLCVLIGYSCLMGVVVREILERLFTKKTKILAGFIIMSTILYNAYPVVTGDVLTYWNNPPHRGEKIPEVYYTTNQWLKDDTEDFRIFVLPCINEPAIWDATIWGHQGSSTIPFLLSKPTILWAPVFYGEGSTYAYQLRNRVYGALYNNETRRLGSLLGLFSVKYVLLDGYFDRRIYSVPSTEWFFATLNSQDGIRTKTNFGELYIYEVDERFFVPHIYATSNAVLINGDIDYFFGILDASTIIVDNKVPVFFLETQFNKSQWQFLQEYSVVKSEYTPKITFQRLNPAEYRIQIENASQPFFLVFSESYHQEWKAYVNEKGYVNWIEALIQPSIPEERHMIANGYANAWYVDPSEIDKDGDGAFTVTLYFRPQSLFYLGATISLATFFFCVLYLSKDRIKVFYSRYLKKKEQRP